MVQVSNPGGGEIFRTHPDWPWAPPSLLYNGYRVYFPGVKWPRDVADHTPPSSAKVKETVELYLYSPFGTLWPVLEWTLPLPLPAEDGTRWAPQSVSQSVSQFRRRESFLNLAAIAKSLYWLSCPATFSSWEHILMFLNVYVLKCLKDRSSRMAGW